MDKLDAIRGSLLGGAVGDALGYAVEFLEEEQIFDIYGEDGITEYDLDPDTDLALISDDTQMSLFTAEGILYGEKENKRLGLSTPVYNYVHKAYKDWLKTQESDVEDVVDPETGEVDGVCQLLKYPELYERRAPGYTCLSELENEHRDVVDFVKARINDSKGCGGVMRVAPLALYYRAGEDRGLGLEELDMMGAQLAALTHGHPLGHMPAAVLTHILAGILTAKEPELEEIVKSSFSMLRNLFEENAATARLIELLKKAVMLSYNAESDADNIHQLGEGWVAEETIAIAVYCSLRYKDDFSKGIIAAVNHNGDSDSTGVLTGNILGALLGYNAIEDKWKENLELREVVEQMAEALYEGID